MATVKAPNFQLRWKLRHYWSLVTLALLALPKALSLLVPRSRRLVLLGAGADHVDNVIGVLAARPGPPAGVKVRVLASARHRADSRLVAAVAALPGAKLLRRRSPAALWACLRATWVLVPNQRLDTWRFWLGKARVVYINHGPWMKRMSPPGRRNWQSRLYGLLYGRYVMVLASTPGEIDAYQTWLGPGLDVVCLGYPRSPVLDGQAKDGLDPAHVGLWPTWKEIDDPSYSHEFARRVHAALVAAGVAGAVVDYRPHHLTPDTPLRLGPKDGRRPGLVVTDFSSVAFDQFYRGGQVLLYSRILDGYLAQRGLRPEMEPWLRSNMVQDEDEAVRRIVALVVAGTKTTRGKGKAAASKLAASDPLRLQPFDSAAFWSRLYPLKA